MIWLRIFFLNIKTYIDYMALDFYWSYPNSEIFLNFKYEVFRLHVEESQQG